MLHGVRPEILALSEIPGVKAYTARQLYRAGLRTPEAVAAADGPAALCAILLQGSSGTAVAAQRGCVACARCWTPLFFV